MKSAAMESAVCTGIEMPKCAGMTSRLHFSAHSVDFAGVAAGPVFPHFLAIFEHLTLADAKVATDS